MKIVSYTVLSAWKLRELEFQVREHVLRDESHALREGWEHKWVPQGGVAVVAIGIKTTYYQAMIKQEIQND